MAFKTVVALDADTTISLGGVNKKTGKKNPTSAEGYYLGSRQVPSTKSKSGFDTLHFLQTPKGNLGVWGKTDLNKKLATVTPGNMIRMSFSKMVPTKNGDMYSFTVEFDAENSIDVSNLESAPEVEAADDLDAFVDDTAAEEYDDTEVEEEAPPVRRSASPTAGSAERAARVQALLGKNKGTRTA